MTALDRHEGSDERPTPAAIPQARPLPKAVPLPLDDSTPPAHQAPLVRPTAPPILRRPASDRPAETVAIAVADDSAADGREGGTRRGLGAASVKSLPPWLISSVAHMAVLIVLGLWMVKSEQDNRILLDVWAMTPAEELGEQLEFDSPLGLDDVEVDQEPILSLSDLPEVEDPLAALSMLDIQPDGTLATSDIEAPSIGLALTGREEGSRTALLRRYGGNATTEAAVLAGLDWLARNQIKSGLGAGSWSLAGPFRDGVPNNYDNPTAATAMALLAFQGRGNTHLGGEYQKNVLLGWKWLLNEQDNDGNFFTRPAPYRHRFYTQAQCTIALCELYGMTRDSRYKESAERAINYCLRWQGEQGGWKYYPGGSSDLSVTGWVVMALQSARMARLEVPEDNLHRIETFLDSVAAEDGSRYCYEVGKMPSLAMTAEGLLCRQYLGWARDDPRLVKGMQWITRTENAIDFNQGRDAYYWYYATQATHHMEGEYWERWNEVMRRVLPQQQLKRGREMGSWDPYQPMADRYAPYGGRLYVTCLSIYMLEVYYRHLPIYTKIYTGRNRL